MDSREHNYELVLVGTSNLRVQPYGLIAKSGLLHQSKDDVDNTASDVLVCHLK